MTDHAPPFVPPRRVLLATDLRSHSDRALDRAVQLARQWQAELHVVHVLAPAREESWPTAPSWRQPPTDAAIAERQLRRDLGDEVPGLVLRVTDGDPAEAILDAAAHGRCDLVVLGAGDTAAHPAGHVTETLLRKSPASLLVVRERPHGGYAHVLVGTDFTAESRHGLVTAAEWFPTARLALMHVLDIPYKSLWLDAGRHEELARMEMATMQSFLADTPLSPEIRAQVLPLVEHGHPEVMLREYVIEKEADLVVIGAFRRGLAFHLLVGGTTRRIVPAVPSDVLLVRAPSD
jgi:nucleotide-binding universal stress UspA family protein